eukprot:CAMPEP_0202350362 /NCGR_PEP_ID=MMETSP1126-20121109/7464_1 /ASSEMBLY_ACC=CAM_ASM_000457 /TAXON_ID=3047 /ORGANISM="Dunaliella tertiolecta, Strain CCMP1320" /LENGTH=130 /DNA_ID=CAMNT_0048942317 /DNA_START=798 /DNA_END=1186 /DNA_ORIENTATION=+
MLDQNHGLRECFTALAPIWKAQQLPELMLSFLGSKPRACHARGDHERPTCGPTNTLQPNLLHQAAPRSSRKSSNKAARQRQHTSGMPLAGTSQGSAHSIHIHAIYLIPCPGFVPANKQKYTADVYRVGQP